MKFFQEDRGQKEDTSHSYVNSLMFGQKPGVYSNFINSINGLSLDLKVGR